MIFTTPSILYLCKRRRKIMSVEKRFTWGFIATLWATHNIDRIPSFNMIQLMITIYIIYRISMSSRFHAAWNLYESNKLWRWVDRLYTYAQSSIWVWKFLYDMSHKVSEINTANSLYIYESNNFGLSALEVTLTQLRHTCNCIVRWVGDNRLVRLMNRKNMYFVVRI